MEVKYVQKGEKGKTCADCRHFKAEAKKKGVGRCFGYEVKAAGGCNMFEPKK